MKILASAVVATALLAGCSHGIFATGERSGPGPNADMPTRATDGRLIGPTGNTLYVYAKDGTGGTSTCYDTCAANWPPLVVAPNAKPLGDYSIVTRSDGTKQWAYRGQPLYYFARDTKSGDMAGDGMGGQWKTVRP